jgi:hypothetical protein
MKKGGEERKKIKRCVLVNYISLSSKVKTSATINHPVEPSLCPVAPARNLTAEAVR